MIAAVLLASILTYIGIGPFIFFLLRLKQLPSLDTLVELNNTYSLIDYLFFLLTDFALTVITWPLLVVGWIKQHLG